MAVADGKVDRGRQTKTPQINNQPPLVFFYLSLLFGYLALTERERQILRLHAEGLSDYRIAHKLNMEMPNVKRSRKNAEKKIELAKADIEFVDKLKSQRTKW